jgi:hypothetical protein
VNAIDENGCLVFGPRSRTCPSWPVRIVGMQGLWRYVGVIPNYDNVDTWVEVIGPYFPSNPSRNGGRSRIFKIDRLKYAGKIAKPIDVLNVETTAISQRAQRR